MRDYCKRLAEKTRPRSFLKKMNSQKLEHVSSGKFPYPNSKVLTGKFPKDHFLFRLKDFQLRSKEAGLPLNAPTDSFTSILKNN
jgi:hypothetical protein